MHYTREQLTVMPTEELVKIYNTITGENLRRFKSRKVGIDRLLAAVAARTRTVSSSGAKKGRPPLEFSVSLGAGTSEVRVASLRGKILQYMRASGKVIPVKELQDKFGGEARGAVLKLLQVNWLKRHDPVPPT